MPQTQPPELRRSASEPSVLERTKKTVATPPNLCETLCSPKWTEVGRSGNRENRDTSRAAAWHLPRPRRREGQTQASGQVPGVSERIRGAKGVHNESRLLYSSNLPHFALETQRKDSERVDRRPEGRGRHRVCRQCPRRGRGVGRPGEAAPPDGFAPRVEPRSPAGLAGVLSGRHQYL